jgi:alpha-glucosidase
LNGALAGLAGWLLLAAGADPPARAGETAAEAPPQTEADEMHRIHTRPSLSNLVDTTGFDFPRRADGVDRRDTGIEIAVDDERLRVDVVREDILRLAISRGGTFEEQPTFATCGATAPVPPFTVRESAGTVTVATAAIELRIAREPFSLDACRPDGSSVFRSLRPAPDHSEAYGRLNNRFVVGRECDPGDAILGLGEKAAPFNRLGRSFVLWNNDIYGEPVEEVRGLPDGAPEKDPRSTGCEPYYMSIPFYCHLSGSRSDQPAAGFFIDNGYRARFDFAGNACRFVFLGGAYAEYVFAGPALRQVLEGYTWLTGRMGLPPLWALGYHQCRWHEYAEDSFLRLANTFRQKHIPCDGLWLDIHYMDGYRVFTWDPRKYPDPPAMLSRLEGLGFRTVTIIDPGGVGVRSLII